MFGIWCSSVTDKLEERKSGLREFVRECLKLDNPELVSLNGDASFRRYFKIPSTGFIAVDSPPDTQKNIEFVSIDEALASSGVRVPTIYFKDLDKGYFIIEDLGNVTFADVSVKNTKLWYKKAIDVLSDILPVRRDDEVLFDEKFIRFELSLFETWMLNKGLNVTLDADEKAILEEAYDELIKVCLSQQQCSMHRDYHSRNLMVRDNELYVIDFQDMVRGPITYDLASLLYDCYVDLAPGLIDSLSAYAYNVFTDKGIIKDTPYEEFVQNMRLTSLQRHIKVLGIFVRLSVRDGKDGYLKDLPRVINYVLKECDISPKFSKLKALIHKYVAGKY